MEEKIFKAYDIRGEWPGEINEEIAAHVGMAVAEFLHGKELVVAYDGRASSPSLAEAVRLGMKKAGVRVLDIGESSTPMFYFSVNRFKKCGGVMVTASHNPGNTNGFKMVDEKGIPILPKDIKHLIMGKGKKQKGGEISKIKVEDEYIDYLVKKSGVEACDLKVSVRGEDKVLAIAKKILNGLGIKLSGSGLVFKFDKDGDRLDVEGLRSDCLFGLFAKEELDKFHIFAPRFVYDLRFSKAVPEYINEHGGRAIRSCVGHAFMKRAMARHGAQVGGELSGHFYFKEMYYMDDAVMAMLKTICLASKSNIVELIKPFQKYFHSGEINIPFEGDAGLVIDKLTDRFEDGEIDMLDGLSVEYPNWWFNIRPSNTESLLRLVVESDSETKMEEMVEEIKEAVR